MVGNKSANVSKKSLSGLQQVLHFMTEVLYVLYLFHDFNLRVRRLKKQRLRKVMSIFLIPGCCRY